MERKEIPILQKDDIEVRIQQACKGNKALALLYKTSRTDMRILDEVFGIYGWKDEYKEIKGNLYCGLSIYDDTKKEWITKWDCGIESQQDDGNERKAEATDALKRSGFKLGIGRELYSSPMIYISAETEVVGKTPKGKDKYGLVNQYEKYRVSRITYNDRREISTLQIIDSKGNSVFDWSLEKGQSPTTHKTSTTINDSDKLSNSSSETEKPAGTHSMSRSEAEEACFASGKLSGVRFGDMPRKTLEWIVDKMDGKFNMAATVILNAREQDGDTF